MSFLLFNTLVSWLDVFLAEGVFYSCFKYSSILPNDFDNSLESTHRSATYVGRKIGRPYI